VDALPVLQWSAQGGVSRMSDPDMIDEIKLPGMAEDELYVAAKELQAPYELVKEVAAAGKLPLVLFTA
jgi:pyridoxal biosynthesis lyase PdxS